MKIKINKTVRNKMVIRPINIKTFKKTSYKNLKKKNKK